MSSYNRLVIPMALLLIAVPVRADKWTGPDKAAHVGVTAGLTAGVYGVLCAYKPKMDMGHRALWSATAGLSAGLLKEGLDLFFNTGEPSYKDLTMDVVGTATGLIFMLIFDFAIGTQHKGR